MGATPQPRGSRLKRQESPLSSGVHGTRGSSLAVLCVDDHRIWLAALRRQFEHAGWTVTGETTAASARRQGLTRRFDFLVVDLRLPDQSGLALLQDLQAAGVTTPAVIVTGYPDDESAFIARQMEVTYLEKANIDLVHLTEAARAASEQAEIGGTSAVTRSLRNVSEALRGMLPAPIPAHDRHLASLLVTQQVSFADFMSIAEAMRLMADQSSNVTPSRRAELISTLAARLEGRRRVARAYGLDAVISQERTLSVSVDATKLANALGWPPRLTAQSLLMRRAVLDVANTSEQVAQIAYRLGFDHHTVFTRQFRAFFGHAPTEFRKLLDG